MENDTSNTTVWKAFIPALILVGIMWVVHILQLTEFPEIVKYGVHPRNTDGLLGIITAPLIHSPNGFSHIINNSIPMLVLTWALYYFYKRLASSVMFVVWVTTGLCVWMSGQEFSNHIGMSGVIYGLAGFLFLSGVLRDHRNLMALSLFVVFEYGSMIWGVFPIKEGVSWESHLWGAIVGLVVAYVLRADGPQRKKYQWEIEEELGLDEDGEEYWKVDETEGHLSREARPVFFRYQFKPKKRKEE